MINPSKSSPQHAVQQLYQQRKAISTRSFKARGSGVDRCLVCQVDKAFCICPLRKAGDTEVGFLLLMYDSEVLKPSNTGRLIADVVPQTFAFIWQRTELDEKLETLLNDPHWQPIIVFPEQYAEPTRVITDVPENLGKCKLKLGVQRKPLFILLDGTWREAKKMFRKSHYLDKFPVLGVAAGNNDKGYHIRQSAHDLQLATAEVAARVLALAGDEKTARHLALWFDVFSYQYQQGVKQTNKGNAGALAAYQDFIDQI